MSVAVMGGAVVLPVELTLAQHPPQRPSPLSNCLSLLPAPAREHLKRIRGSVPGLLFIIMYIVGPKLPFAHRPSVPTLPRTAHHRPWRRPDGLDAEEHCLHYQRR